MLLALMWFHQFIILHFMFFNRDTNMSSNMNEWMNEQNKYTFVIQTSKLVGFKFEKSHFKVKILYMHMGICECYCIFIVSKWCYHYHKTPYANANIISFLFVQQCIVSPTSLKISIVYRDKTETSFLLLVLVYHVFMRSGFMC